MTTLLFEIVQSRRRQTPACVKALAEMAVKGNDKQVLDILAAQGLSVTVNAGCGRSAVVDAAVRATGRHARPNRINRSTTIAG
jgi:hypothetical protein